MASNSDGKDDFSLMQHLIDEMDASNQRIEMFSQKFDSDVNKVEALYDDAWKSEESDGASLQEVPLQFASNAADSGCEEVVNSAIAEVSNDFLSGLRQTAARDQYVDSDESRISSDNDFKILRGMASYARYPETTTGLSDTDWNPYGTESDNNQSPRLHPQENDSKSSLFTSFTPLMNSTDINTVTPSSGVKILQSSNDRMSDILERTERESTLNSHTTTLKGSSTSISQDPTLKELYSPISSRRPDQNFSCANKQNRDKELSSHQENVAASSSSTGYSSGPASVQTDGEGVNSKPLSVIERAKLMGVPEEILLDKRSTCKSKTKTGEFHRKFCNSPEDIVNLSDDRLGQKVKALLSDTTHLSTYDKTGSSSSVDYTVLQKDLQEIQDNLDNFGVSLQGNSYEIDARGKPKSQASSEGDGDIIPSTTTTPEKKKERMLWDFADLGCLGEEHPGLLGEISLTTVPSNRPSTEKPVYNSDGDETRTSESSAKDHAAADQALAEMSEILPISMRNLNTSTDVNRTVSTLIDQRRRVESGYQQLNNQGLAEKVFRILTNQNPESHANGILSEISADEKDMRTRMVLDMHDKNFNYSSTSSWLDDVNQSFNPPNCDVKKRLDMSGLSSRDSSWLFPPTKGFSAIDDAKRLLSSQMAKASERTFNHSIEMKVPPQTIQCYPLVLGKGDYDANKNELKEDEEKEVKGDSSDQEPVESSLHQYTRDSSDNSQPDIGEENARSIPSLTDSDSKSNIRSKDKYLPYRPPGSKQVYYIESDTASVADSVTTLESTHIGSDDARGPSLPSHAFGSRKDPSSANSGIYSSHQGNLSTVREDTELGTIEEKTERADSNSSKNDTEASCLTSKHKAKMADDDPTKDRISYGSGGGVEAARLEARWAHRRDEMNQEGRVSAISDRRPNTSPTPGMDRRANSRSPPDHQIDAARRDARWDNRKEEVDREIRAGVSDRRRSKSPTPGIDAARREAKWSLRTEKEADRKGHTAGGEQENEPISLRIRMTYSDDRDERDKILDYERARERPRFLAERDRSSPELRDTFPSSSSNPHYDRRAMDRAASDENLTTGGYGNLSPAFQSALDSGMRRTGSDENLNSSIKDARLSPAFRRALSPDLRHSIERRSPLLSRHLERSLAQPASEYPGEGRMRFDDGRFDRTRPPTFLARDRPLSPPSSRVRDRPVSPQSRMARDRSLSPECSRARRPFADISDQVSRDLATSNVGRPRSVSPPYLERISQRIGSPVGGQNEAEKLEESKSHSQRVFGSNDQPNIKSKRKVELTLEGMSSESDADLEVDQEPLTKRTQLLKAALSNQQEPYLSQNINDMWERYRAVNDSGNSSINSSKMEAISDFLKSPSRHLVSQYMRDREEYRIQRQERAELERERKLQEQTHKHSSSEDEINERYAELLALKEEERMKRRVSKKKKGRNSSYAPTEHKNEKDNLFSIPEDRSHDPSPNKANTPSSSSSVKQKSKAGRQTHVIDPNMLKLRERIAKQKTKVDKDMLKEMRRIEKLKKLESLLSAKKNCKISNESLQSQLDELSSTSAIASDYSHESGPDLVSNFQAMSDDSTTAKDSSAEMHAWKAEKERRQKMFQLQKQAEGERRGLKSRNANTNHSKKSLSNFSTSLKDTSEIKLLKLVTEGYLTAEEAYKLAVERASQSGHPDLDVSSESGKPHKMYSPYSRSANHFTQPRHVVPKLKHSGSSGPHSSYGVGDGDDLHQKFIDDKERKLTQMLSDQRHRSTARGDGRSKSQSLSSEMTYSPVRREKSFSPSSSTRRSAQPASRQQWHSTSPAGRSGRNSRDPYHVKKVKRNLQQSKTYRSENDVPGHREQLPVRESVSWHIPMDLPSRQWKEPEVSTKTQQSQHPLQEVTSSVTNRHRKGDDRSETAPRFFYNSVGGMEEGRENQGRRNASQNGNIWTKTGSHPRGIPKEQWENVVRSDALASKTNHREVDPLMDRVQYILDKPGGGGEGDGSHMTNISTDSDGWEKPLSKMSLQEAFMTRQQRFISKSSERQKRLRLAKEDRQLQECLRLEREAIFAEQQRLAPPNLYAHPYSDNLYQPKHRILTKQEMKSLTAKRYNKLPEVVGKKEEDKKEIESKLNRLRASLFNKKVQRDVLRKSLKTRC